MDDVIRQVVFAIGDEDLLTEETIRAVGVSLGTRAPR